MVHDVLGLVEALLRDHPPNTTEPQTFWAAQYDAGLAWVHFPIGLGGLGLDRQLQQLVGARLEAAGAPRPEPYNLIGVAMMAPTLIEHATGAQQARYIRPAFIATERWCQLFSEPGAGSDLASLTTRAELDGDTWVVTGQKVWTTMAHRADYALLLARSERDQPRHAGLSYFILDMRREGVEVRPLRQITGDAEYNEVFLSETRIPDDQRIGPRGAGWRVAMSTLMNERTGLRSAVGSRRGEGQLIRRPVTLWDHVPADARTPIARDRLARLWIDAEVLRLTMERSEQAERNGTPGTGGSLIKLSFGALAQAAAAFSVDLSGPAGGLIDNYDLIQPEFFTQVGAREEAALNPARVLLASQALTIGGGTTNINKNVVAERLLRLPAEPRP